MLREVTIENGIVRGLPAADPRITSFKGIPFAAPPVGENRWRAPMPAHDWDGVLKAFEFAPVSMQGKIGINKEDIYTREWNVDPNIPMDEDCLYLNIWTPAHRTDEKLPVYVWYFGGGLQVGNTAEMEFDGERIARRGIVVVTINYRLNAFGFLCHPEITAEAPEAPANFGHLDQQAGTQWVKRNITAFGGDPDNITIGGQSAGGGSVLSQLTSPQNENLFQKAIIQSGIITKLYPGNRTPGIRSNLAEAERDGIEFFEFLGVSSLKEARNLDAEYIRDKSIEYRKSWLHWGTVVDGRFCVGNAFELFLENRRWMVPVLFGHTSSEFFSVPDVKTLDEFRQMAFDMFGDDSEKYVEFCLKESEDLEETLKRASVSAFEYAIRIAGQANEDTGANIPMYYYNFDAEIPGYDSPGTFHSVDLWFFFETLAKCWRPFVGKHYDLSRQMCNYWANFIRSGNPNGKDSTGEELPRWDPYTPKDPYGMVFRDKSEFVREQPSDLMKFLVEQYFKKK
ncbi:carboxylesterase/lipase family protein [Lederbergia wuyishanensis]|uniref:Carboxylic ester hydrolase n=1 Tax=Lederbergia wuyishanensis TaxID=1347903 RepID=A0ABU0D9W3_9BACI|nr:carboxylesterase family protein [Lederbergia wuyishanensis]MCJ8008437.1 carboxylesterase family protein [Lederbergia wuyishanensis]MDQ0345180.1 para-nitrobenzyl esterase [Lederbergia wuyishanensis]